MGRFRGEEEHDDMVAAVAHLMDKGEHHLSPEESALLETMAILVQAYNDRQNPLRQIAPNEMLAYLMETSGRTTKDLLAVFGTRERVSEALSGKRSISKEQASYDSPAERGRDRHPGTGVDAEGLGGKA